MNIFSNALHPLRPEPPPCFPPTRLEEKLSELTLAVESLKSQAERRDLIIHAASFGPGEWHDVTMQARDAVSNGVFRTMVGGPECVFGDPDIGVRKTFIAVYSVTDSSAIIPRVDLFSCESPQQPLRPCVSGLSSILDFCCDLAQAARERRSCSASPARS
jgi:hypothetical protein